MWSLLRRFRLKAKDTYVFLAFLALSKIKVYYEFLWGDLFSIF